MFACCEFLALGAFKVGACCCISAFDIACSHHDYLGGNKDYQTKDINAEEDQAPLDSGLRPPGGSDQQSVGSQPHHDTGERWKCGSQSNGTNEEYCLEGVLEHRVHLSLECLRLKDEHILELDDLVVFDM